MNTDEVITALSAPAQATHLDTFHLLVRHEPEGVAAGELARTVGVRRNTTSAHLAILSRAGLVIGERHSRTIFDGVDARYKRVLWTVLAINGVMLLVEMAAGQLAGSRALQADALDFLGDTITYGLNLAVIGSGIETRSIAALFEGLSRSVMPLWVFGSTFYDTLILGIPSAEVMGGIGMLALTADVASVLLLMRCKDGDANVRSVWLCSRNDGIGNVVVMLAALGVWGSSSAWPDLAVAAVVAGIFLTSSFQILRQAWTEYSSRELQAENARPNTIRRPPASSSESRSRRSARTATDANLRAADGCHG